MPTQKAISVDPDQLDTKRLLQVLVSVKKGDFSARLPAGWTGLNGKIADTLNDIIEMIADGAKEFERVSRVVGEEGKLSQRAAMPSGGGAWKSRVNAINELIDNLVRPTTEMARVIGAVAKGNLTQTVALEAEGQPLRGEFLRIAKMVNGMVQQLDTFAAEVTRVAREVGTEGKLGGQAAVRGVAGTWKDLTDSVNAMAGNLTAQVRNIADVTIAVANGDLSKKITVDVRGEILQLKDAINTMIDQLRSFAAEVTRVAREVGTEGKLGGQAQVRDVSGVWKDLTDSVNMMAGNLTAQVRNIADVTIAVANGDLSRKITVDVRGEILQLKDTINTMVDQLNAFAAEVTRVAREVGTEGKLGGQAEVRDVSGVWKDLTESVNIMAGNLTAQVRNIADVTIAVANGDLSKKITVDVRGEILQLKDAINTMVDQLNAFAAEVTRVAREVGTEGKLGGQALVPGVAGTWKDLTDNVNVMAANLTAQVRGIVKVVTAVANGSLKEKLTVETKGEVAALAETINNMTDTLAIFAEQVTTVAREVGVEGGLGGQANVPGAAGIWKNLTDNVNLLAANLTTQVRAIADVATAVTKGDLTRAIHVDARGEVAELKDNINAMIQNLRGTTEQNTEQDWLKTNLARFTSMLQGQRDLTTVGRMLLSQLAPLVRAQYGAIYQMDSSNGVPHLLRLAGYAREDGQDENARLSLGVGLVGQCALEKSRILLSDIPQDYVRINSGLGEAQPRNLIVLPVLFEGQTKAVIELASLAEFTPTHLTFLDQLTESIGIVLNTIEATMRTEGLLQQSQKLATELQAQQRELQQTNAELANKAQQLAEQNAEVERKNNEIEQARHAVEEKAAELALTSKYKSDFLANMSHELRTPLNSILILAQQLADNRDGNLNSKQVEFAKNVHAAGTDLLNLISDILDLSKIESGTVTVEPEEVSFEKLRDAVERGFRHMAEAKHLAFDIELEPQLPHSLSTDLKRLQQVLKNLLSNAFKFTSRGRVDFRIAVAGAGWSPDHAVLNGASRVIAFEVRDTGIGIQPEKQRIIFEAFHQADAGTSRRYGGTGLGLAISRELATLLGGEIRLTSTPSHGSTFTLYLPENYLGSLAPAAIRKIPESLRLAPLIVQQAPKVEAIADDRESVLPDDPTVLIVEDDPHFARVLLDLVRQKGFKGVVTAQGGHVRSLAREFKPLAIMLDIFLPDMLGWTVLNHLKQDASLRHIPVQIISVAEERRQGLGRGAFSFLIKPATTDELETAFDRVIEYAQSPHRRLLIVEDNELERQSVVELLSHDGVEIATAGSGAEAWNALQAGKFDCVVLDLRLPDISGFELMERIRQQSELRELPIIVCTGKDLTEEDEIQLVRMAESVVLKNVQSPERLLDETSLSLHLVAAELPPHKQQMLERLRQSDEALRGRKVLVVDDDVRNIFALTSLLERHGVRVVSAETGAEAVSRLARDQDIDAVLMDIMMPGMDGYETIRRIRQNRRRRLMPILALTAKAMKGDREKCLDAGASDYIAKPVNTDELLALLRIWLFGKQRSGRKYS
jgi:CheY-like chemotaxis protein